MLIDSDEAGIFAHGVVGIVWDDSGDIGDSGGWLLRWGLFRQWSIGGPRSYPKFFNYCAH